MQRRPVRRAGDAAHLVRRVIDAYLSARGSALAAGVAYFALLSFVPLLFVAVSVVGLFGEQTEQSALIEQLRQAFPGSSVEDILDAVSALQDRALSIGLLGGALLLWGSLGLFQALAAAIDSVNGMPGRSFLRQRARSFALVLASSLLLGLALVVGTFGAEVIQRAGVSGSVAGQLAGIAASSALLLAFVWGMYTLLPNTPHRWRRTLPGALLAAVLIQATAQLLPLYVRLTARSTVLQALGGLALLLVWLYLMASLLILGAVLNRELASGSGRRRLAGPPP